VLFSGREPDNITGPNFFDRTAFPLNPAEAGCHDQGLPKRMSVPRRTRTGLACDMGSVHERRIGRAEQQINADRAGKNSRLDLCPKAARRFAGFP
jgi:hypothetical protein